jgi:hypothetical protein
MELGKDWDKTIPPFTKTDLLGAGTRRSKRLNPPGRPPTPARVTKRRGTILNDNTRKSQPVRNETPRRLVQYFLKTQLDVESVEPAMGATTSAYEEVPGIRELLCGRGTGAGK